MPHARRPGGRAEHPRVDVVASWVVPDVNESTPATAAPLARLIDELYKLPGIGPKSAQRLAYYLLRMPAAEAQALASAIVEVKERVTFCSICQNVTEVDPCRICTDGERDRTIICVVEEPLDILAIERTQCYRGSASRAARGDFADRRDRAGGPEGVGAAAAAAFGRGSARSSWRRTRTLKARRRRCT